jgi:hypothetical protein
MRKEGINESQKKRGQINKFEINAHSAANKKNEYNDTSSTQYDIN